MKMKNTIIVFPIGVQNSLVFSTISPVNVKDDVAVNNDFINEFSSGLTVDCGKRSKNVSIIIIDTYNKNNVRDGL